MTNSFPPEPPQSPEPPASQPRSPLVSFDEFIAIVVAFTTMGAILFWTVGDQVKQLIPGNLVPTGTTLPTVPNVPGIPGIPQPDSDTGVRQQPANPDNSSN